MTIVRISDEMQWHSVLWASLGVALVYILSKCFYNLFLHPLSGFPGPKLAAMSNMYEFWYDVVRDGTYIWQVEKMHQVYGPIVRVNVGELHIRDSEFYSSIYTSGTRKVNKDPDTYKAFGFPGSTGATIDHDLHRVRRGYMNPYFSKRAIVEMESLIHERTDRLFRRLEEAATNGTVVNLNSAFAALTADVITKRFYGEHFDFVGEPGFKAVATDAILGLSTVFNVARFFPGAVSAFTNLPRGIVRITVQPVAALLDFQDDVRAKILSCLKTVEGPQSKSIMASLLNDAHIPAEEKDIGRLVDDSISFVFGGTESTARTISTIVFHLLNNKTHLKKLREELDAVLPAQLDQHEYSMTQLRHLSYLSGVVYEGLWLSFGFVSRLPRVAVDEPLQYGNFLIPRGIPVSQSTYFVHTDPAIYPDPHSFHPQRWIKHHDNDMSLSKFLVSFSKGRRHCIGMELALSQIFLVVVRLVRTFELDLHETTMDDIKIRHVHLLGYPRRKKHSVDSRGAIRVKIVGKATF